MTDTEKLSSSKSDCSTGRCTSIKSRRITRDAISTCDEKSVDSLYLRAVANARSTRKSVDSTRQTLLVIGCDYPGNGSETLAVLKGDVVALLSTHLFGWFWVRNREGGEGFIPAAIAGHGFL